VALTLKIEEGEPASWPEVEDLRLIGLPEKYEAVFWRRIEDYLGRRYAARAVTFFVEGPGEWTPPIEPVSGLSVEVFDAGGWASVEPEATAFGGFVLPATGPYRIAGTAGDDSEPPQLVKSAVAALAGYAAAADSNAPRGASAYSMSVGGVIEERVRRDPAFLAKAIDYSGAGDMLRHLRRVRA